MNRIITYFVRVLIVFSVIGLGTMAFTSPQTLFKDIATFIIFGMIFFFIVRYLIIGSKSIEDSGYKKALKQSKKRWNSSTASKKTFSSSFNKKSKTTIAKRKHRDASHLTVIEGKKNTKKQA